MDRSKRGPHAQVSDTPWIIVGQGLAGTCLAWDLWKRGVPFTIVDREQGGSSRVAAGLINPVTGKNFEPSAYFREFLLDALALYTDIELKLGVTFLFPMPILRLAESEKEWAKMTDKSTRPDVARWLVGNHHIDGWTGALELNGGGRLDTRSFLDASRVFFRRHGIYQTGTISIAASTPRHIWCEGAAGLVTDRYGTHRCAKGEILTLRAKGWDEDRIRIGAGGWLVPLGNDLFKCGSTYEWGQLDEIPSPQGMERVRSIAARLGGASFEIIAHEAGIRPILRRSEPLIGPLPSGGWMFNGLGSKGSLYAPGIARRLGAWLTDGTPPEAACDFRNFNPPPER
jgi:glycine oxidase